MGHHLYPAPPGIQTLLRTLARVEGTVTITGGIITFPNGTTADISHLTEDGISTCYHCSGVMSALQRYICGCPKCMP